VQREKHHYTKKGVSCMKNLKVLAVAGVVSAVMFTGCEKAPQVEIEKAKQAVTAAETEASAYAADKVAAAKAALDSALAAVKAEDAKLIKNYAAAKGKLAAAVTAAEVATAEAAKYKETMKTEATELVGKAKAAVGQSKRAVAIAKNKATGVVRTLVADAEMSLAAAEKALTGNDFAAAKTNASAAIEKTHQAAKQLRKK
jgi:hypothetical protein